MAVDVYPEDKVAADPGFQRVLETFRNSDLSMIDLDGIMDKLQDEAHKRNTDPMRRYAERGFGSANYSENASKLVARDNNMNAELLDYTMLLMRAKGFVDDLVKSTVATYAALYRADFKQAGHSVTESQELVRFLLRDIIRFQSRVDTGLDMLEAFGKALLTSHYANRFCHEAYARVAYDRGI